MTHLRKKVIVMEAHPVQVILPEKLAEEIDALVGRDGRSAFVVETTEAEVRRRSRNATQAEEKKKRLLALLRDDMPAWKDENHPELADGAYAWVKKMRQEGDRRIPDDGLSGVDTK